VKDGSGNPFSGLPEARKEILKKIAAYSLTATGRFFEL
jgi:hypothetical protein